MVTPPGAWHSPPMISELKIGNFKAFGPAQTIPLRPITLVFGPNSAGKSSIIQSLLLARHVQETGRWDAYQTKLGGSAVDLGGFNQYIHRHEKTHRELILSFAFESNGFTCKVGLQHVIGSADAPPVPQIKEIGILIGGLEVMALTWKDSGTFGCDRFNADHPAVVSSMTRCIAELYAHECTMHLLDAAPEPKLEEMTRKLKGDAIEQLPTALDQIEIIADGLKLEQRKRLSDHYSEGDSIEDPEGSGEPYVQIRDVWASDDRIGFARSQWKAKSDAEAIALWVRKDIEDLIDSLSRSLGQNLASTLYLGPLRSFPSRYFQSAGEDDLDWMAGGGWAWETIRTQPQVREEINRLLEQVFKSPYRLELRPLMRSIDDAAISEAVSDAIEDQRVRRARSEYAETLKVAEEPYLGNQLPDDERRLIESITSKLRAAAGGEVLTELILLDQRNDTKVSHRDVGIGISQVLPVLVSALASKNALITMEQPELHLHPALQAELGDVFIESALGANKNTFLIETHSEHLILRILRRIRETAENALPENVTPIRPEDVCVLYIEPGKDGSRVVHLPVNAEGDFDKPWPDGFFSERAKELF